MGNLALERGTPDFPFLNSGVDFCGPFRIKYNNQKGVYSKVYMAIFICIFTNAIHQEIVSYLSAAAFITVLKRFCANRNNVDARSFDNAINFMGNKK